MNLSDCMVIFTTYQGSILGPIARLLGKILEGIYFVLSKVGIENTGLCIILFTFLINALMIPLQVKQQKFTKMSSIMNPEIQAIQEKYKGKTDQESQRLMNYEMQAIYTKYGVSPASGCLPILITFPIIFALYRVIYNIPAYVPQVYSIYEKLANSIMDAGATVESLKEYITVNTYVVNDAVKKAANDPNNVNYFIDLLSQFTPSTFKELAKDYPDLSSQITTVSSEVKKVNSFLGLNIADTPSLKSVSVLIPIVSVITQFISTKISMNNNNTQQNDNSNSSGAMATTQASMKMMTNVMPFVSGAMCFMFPIGVGIYWIAGNIFRIVQTLCINLYFDKHDYDKEMDNNIEKSKKRFKMMGLDDKQIKDIHKSANSGATSEPATPVVEDTQSNSISKYTGAVKSSNSKQNSKSKKKNSSNNESKASKDTDVNTDVAESSTNVDEGKKESKKNDGSGTGSSISSYANFLNRND